MSVVVRMEMPLDCQYCPMAHWDIRNRLMGCEAANGKRYLQGKDDEFWENGRPSWCPIICSLPEGHGRLVDADANFLGVIHLSSGGFVNYNTTIAERLGEEDMRMVKVIVPAKRSET